MSDGPINRPVFTELQDTMGSDFAEELVATFLDEAPGILAELRSAAAGGEQDRFRRAAHSIKSNANIFGADDLAALARQLEIAGLSADPAANAAQLATLDAQYERTAAALRDLHDG